MNLKPFSALLCAVAMAASSLVLAQQQSAGSVNTDRKQTEIVRTSLTPVLDGVLDDPIWQQATMIDDLHQTTPVDMGPPSERSEFYVAYSEDYFYLAARLYDSQPGAISARQMIQGQNFRFDDSVSVMLDTFNNSRTGFYFETNPNGMRRDGVYEGPGSFNADWSGIWQVASRIDDEGWTAEFAIPFTTLNFDPTSDSWGFNVGRDITRTNEQISWSSFNRSTNPSTAGLISGISGIEQGLGLDIVPSVTFAQDANHVTDQSGDRLDPSLDIFYKFTPNLTGALTFNTDFSATEADDRQVNLTRFSLFFDEKRDFFLQDSEIFSFGDFGGFGGGSNGLPFYSRRIGLDPATGQPVDIDAGAKLAGRVGDISVGLLAVQQGDRPGLDGQSVMVGRITSNVLAESRVGAILTYGDPNSETDSKLAGVDFSYRNTRFTDRYTLTSTVWYQQSDVEGVNGDDKAYNADLEFSTQNNGFSPDISYTYIGADFDPKLGFTNRQGIEEVSSGLSYRYFFRDNALFRSLNSFSRYTRTESASTGELETESAFWRLFNLNTHQGDSMGLAVNYNRDIPTEAFTILDVPFNAGEYAYSTISLNFNGSNNRSLSPDISYQVGEFYTADRETVDVGLDWRPNSRIALEFSYEINDIQLDTTRVISRQITVDASLAIDPEWSWISLLQYENSSDTFGINSRLHWTPQAGEHFYFVLNYNFDSSEGAFKGMNPLQSEMVFKYTRNFRF